MYTKQTNLFLTESDALIEMEYAHGDIVIFTVNELEKDEEKSTKDNSVMKTARTAEIYIGIEEVKELIRSLQFLIPEGGS